MLSAFMDMMERKMQNCVRKLLNVIENKMMIMSLNSFGMMMKKYSEGSLVK
jgi:hypothetical protein